MSITKPFTFVAGTKARANEVNADFDELYRQVNKNISNISQNALDIDNLDNNKANINGNSTEVFNVADASASTHAVNKQTLFKYIENTLDFINGLTISKDSGSPNDTIIVSPGSCYDSTKTMVLELANSTSKQNTNQGASTTYYVHIIGNDVGTSTDILISSSQLTPTLPTGYTLFRNIGSYTTNSSSKINVITNLSTGGSIADLNGSKLSATQSKAAKGYCKFSNGIILQWGTQHVYGGENTYTINFATAFSSTNYSPAGTWTAHQNAGDKSIVWRVTNKSTGSMSIESQLNSFNSQEADIYWQVIGY